MRFWMPLPVLAFMAAMGLLVAAPAAQAQFGIAPGDDGWRAQVFSSESEDLTRSFTEHGTGVFDQAGGHPYKGITDFILVGTAENNVENLRVDVPAGLVPNPELTVRCSDAEMELSLCPSASQIGTEDLTIGLRSVPGVTATLRLPLYNMEVADDQVARFAFNPADAAAVPGTGLLLGALGLHQVDIIGGVRDAPDSANPPGADAFAYPVDHGLFFTIHDITPNSPVIRSKLTFWGVPGEPAHAPLAPGPSLEPTPTIGQSCITGIPDPVLEGLGIPLGLPECVNRPPVGPLPDPQLPFLSNPTACTGAKLTSRLFVDSTPPGEPGPTDSRIDQTPTIEGKEGAQRCDLVPVDGGVAITADTGAPDAPTGPAIAITVPQPGLHDRDVLATSHVKDVAVTLPPGMTLNPSGANGLVACTDAQLAVAPGVVGGEQCPAASRIGNVTVRTPLLPDAMTGSAYVGQPLVGDRYRMFVTIEGRGVSIRLKGSVRPHPATGRITATFPDNPQLPFDELEVDLRGGARAPLATPLDCGPKAVVAALTPWSGTGAIARTSNPFAIAGAGCPAGFAPGFHAATARPVSGAFAPFSVAVARPDRHQFLSGVRVDTPPGLAGMISRVEQCPDAAAATGACPAASRIGTVRTASGAGPEPYRLSGPVYLTDRYKRAPFGMVAVIRAIAGPYDLGTAIVRQRVYVDSEDAHVSVISDPLPRILEGVPIRLRDLHVSIDRPGFAFNPTSCGPKRVEGTLHSTAGTALRRHAGVRFDGCERLDFSPRMALTLIGRRQARFRGHPALHARVRQPARQANFSRVRVKLPASLALDPRNSQVVCGFEAAKRADCPRRTRIGFARVVSPALNRPLRGPLYLVQGIRVDPDTGNRIRTLPSLLAKLSGEVRINLRATTEVVGRRSNLVSTFRALPDAPVRRVDVRVRGGKRGILAVTARRGLCAKPRRQLSRRWMVAQNGKVARSRARVATPCTRAQRRQARG